jgi:hypothetical protein
MLPYTRRQSFTLAATALTVLSGDFLLGGTNAGWVWSVLLILFTSLTCIRHPLVLGSPAGRCLLIAAIGLAAELTCLHSWLALVLGAGSILGMVQIGRNAWRADLMFWVENSFRLIMGIWPRFWKDITLLRYRNIFLSRTSPQRLRIIGWAVPVGLGLVFAALFGTANPIIGNWSGRAWRWLFELLSHIVFLPAPMRVALWLNLVAASWLVLRVHNIRAKAIAVAVPGERPRAQRLTFIVRCLAVFNAIFAAQTFLDVYYLWGGMALPKGMTYASYAHHGAYPLMATALLAATFVLICFRRGGAATASPWSRYLVFAWLIQNVFLVISALWRLHLYVDVYSLTLWRVTAAVWMMLVAIGLVLIGWRIIVDRNGRWLINANACCLVIMLGAISAVDIRGAIAWHNVTGCREAGGTAAAIDLDYLADLGIKAAPALTWLSHHCSDVKAAQRASALADKQKMELNLMLGDWRCWTLARWRISHSLDSSHDQGTPARHWPDPYL